uniref:Uncharacterized protein n=1 Tax=Meloidogyne enterolobii TaxID=390850 RepID=A0A6V7VM13_MELEN|nr:unnamed protein product [Meloidogyne enterolobii]
MKLFIMFVVIKKYRSARTNVKNNTLMSHFSSKRMYVNMLRLAKYFY